MLRIFLAAALLCVVGPAFADTVSGARFWNMAAEAVTAPATWSPGPLYIFLEPYLLSAFGVVITILLTWLCSILKAKFNLDISNSAQANLQQTALNAAGRIMASQEARFSSAQIDVRSPLIAAELPKVMVSAEDAIKSLNLTPDRVSSLILAKVGQLQVAAQSSPPVVAVIPAVDTPKVPS